MENQKEKSEILVKATAQGFSITIYGRKTADQSWKCAIEINEIVYTEIPTDEHVTSLGEQRNYKKTEFKFSFEEAFKKFDDSEWFLCHPSKLHDDFTDFVINALDQRMEEYEREFPADSPMEKFIRKNKIEEWKAKASSNQSGGFR